MTATSFLTNAFDLSPRAPLISACDTGPIDVGHFPTIDGTQLYEQLQKFGEPLSRCELRNDGPMDVRVWAAGQQMHSALTETDQAVILCYNQVDGSIMLSAARSRENPFIVVAPGHFVALFYDREWRFAAAATNSDQKRILVPCTPSARHQAALVEDLVARLGTPVGPV